MSEIYSGSYFLIMTKNDGMTQIVAEPGGVNLFDENGNMFFLPD
ncbi:hypothetical protein [Pseudobacteroides cellulosolvens]|nr:hypothetical protein [Pseudobacteroides cellulosolvens]